MDLLKLHLYAKGKKGGGITPSGIIAINENGDHDVTQYASAAVNVPVGVFPEGDLNIVENGSYDVTQYANVNVEVSTGGSGGGGAEGGTDQLMAVIEGNITELNSNATTIRDYAFYGCSRFTSVDLPMATSIGSNAFYSCYSLTAVILRSETLCSILNTNAFTNCYHFLGTVNNTYNPNGLKDGYIYVPAALIDSYKVATNWSNFSTQFRALEDYTVDGTTTGALDESKI